MIFCFLRYLHSLLPVSFHLIFRVKHLSGSTLEELTSWSHFLFVALTLPVLIPLCWLRSISVLLPFGWELYSSSLSIFVEEGSFSTSSPSVHILFLWGGASSLRAMQLNLRCLPRNGYEFFVLLLSLILLWTYGFLLSLLSNAALILGIIVGIVYAGDKIHYDGSKPTGVFSWSFPIAIGTFVVRIFSVSLLFSFSLAVFIVSWLRTMSWKNVKGIILTIIYVWDYIYRLETDLRVSFFSRLFVCLFFFHGFSIALKAWD